METLWQDLRYGLRMLRRSPGFTAVAVLTLALGIGANTAIFTVGSAALLRSLPYKDPDRLVHLWETNQQQEFNQREASYPDYLDWKEQNHIFEQMAGYNGGSLTLTGRDVPEQIQAARVTASFFSVLGVEAGLGRTFRPEEDRPDAERLVILSHRLWQRRFGADPKVIGQTLTLDGNAYTVIGVLPPRFHFAKVGTAELWVSLKPDSHEMTRRFFHWLNVIARLKPGVTFEQAQTEMGTIARRLEQEHPKSHTGVGIKLVSLYEEVVRPIRPVMLVLLGAVGVVLLIACANVANLLMARAAQRHKEIAIRVALGASRLRLMQQLLTESVLLALLGGALGLLWAQWGIELLVAAIPESLMNFMPYLQGLTINSRVLGLTGALSLLTGIVFGLAPALQASKPELQESLKEGGKTPMGRTRQGLRDVLVVSQIGLALVLSVGAGLMTKSVLRLLDVDPGFNANNLLTIQISLPPARYSKTSQMVALHQQLLERIGSVPGVKGVGTVSSLPLGGGGGTGGFLVEGQTTRAPGEEPQANMRTVSASYFPVMGIPLVKGRYFTEQDNYAAPKVLIVNQTLAGRVFPNRDAIGQRIVFTFSAQRQPWEIVGVVGNENVTSLDAKMTPVVYFPYLQDVESSMCLVVRTASEPMGLANAVRREVQALDQDVPVFSVMTMEQLIYNSPSTFVRRYPALLIGVFAGMALALAVVGVYGVVSYWVNQRTHEFGIRMALGAQAGDVLRLVVGHGVQLVLCGIGIGLVGALALTRVLSSLLYGVSATDPATFMSISLLLAGVALLASYIPARRATKVDPMVALRYE